MNTSEKEICFIPTAANVEQYRVYVDEAKDVFKEMGYQINTLDISEIQRDEIIKTLSHCHCLYVSGGNTFYLLQELKRKELIQYIRDRVSEGMLYIGESAGAIITTKNIEYNQIMDDKTVASDLTDYSGLSLIDFYVVPHNNEFPFIESTIETIKVYKNSLKLLAINNSEAIIVDDGEVNIKR